MNKYKLTALVPMSVEINAQNPIQARVLFDIWRAEGMHARGVVDASRFAMLVIKIEGPGCDKDAVLAIIHPRPEPTEVA